MRGTLVMKHYIKAGFDNDIKALPEAVQTWFQDKYELFDDWSHANESWPTFHMFSKARKGLTYSMMFSLSGLSDEDMGAGYRISIVNVDGEHICTLLEQENSDIDDINWVTMMKIVELYV